jgi:hypothetical protein
MGNPKIIVTSFPHNDQYCNVPEYWRFLLNHPVYFSYYEDGTSMLLRNIDTYLLNYMTPYVQGDCNVHCRFAPRPDLLTEFTDWNRR